MSSNDYRKVLAEKNIKKMEKERKQHIKDGITTISGYITKNIEMFYIGEPIKLYLSEGQIFWDNLYSISELEVTKHEILPEIAKVLKLDGWLITWIERPKYITVIVTADPEYIPYISKIESNKLVLWLKSLFKNKK
jgi:hypothetical protein